MYDGMIYVRQIDIRRDGVVDVETYVIIEVTRKKLGDYY